MEENLKRKTTKALVWSTADKLGQQLFYLVAGIILARQLSPEDYGKVGVLTIFIALSGILIDSGFSSALIRKKEVTQADYSTVFYVNVAISCVLYGLLYAAAPYIAVFFKVPDLIYICRILFLVIPLNALSLIQQTLLLKHFKLSVSARVNLWSLGIASVVAIAMAYGGMGVWSLVAQTLGLSFFRAVFFWVFNDWRPRWIFRMASLREFFGYSSNLVVLWHDADRLLYSGRQVSGYSFFAYQQYIPFGRFPCFLEGARRFATVETDLPEECTGHCVFHFSYHAVDGRRFVSAHIDHVERAMGFVRAVFPLALFFGNMLSVYYFVFRFVQ